MRTVKRSRLMPIVLASILALGLAGGCWEKKENDNATMLGLLLILFQHSSATVTFKNSSGSAASPYLSTRSDCATSVLGAAMSNLLNGATSTAMSFDSGSYYACNNNGSGYHPSAGTYTFAGGTQTLVTLNGGTSYTFTAQ